MRSLSRTLVGRSIGVVAAVGLVVLAGCSSDTAEPAITTELPAALDAPAIEGATTDATIGSVTIGEVITFAPADWQFDSDSGRFSPAPDSGWADGTYWAVTDQCADECIRRTEAQWADVLDARLDAWAASEGDVVRDDAVIGGRLVEVANADGMSALAIARAVDGQPKYLWCEVSGEAEAIAPLIAAMEFACENTKASLE